jgi:hypothetical protein
MIKATLGNIIITIANKLKIKRTLSELSRALAGIFKGEYK